MRLFRTSMLSTHSICVILATLAWSGLMVLAAAQDSIAENLQSPSVITRTQAIGDGTPVLTPGQVLTGLWDSFTAGPYILQQNHWGLHGIGSQNSTFYSLSGVRKNIMSWSTEYHWRNATGSVKSYTNVGLTEGLGATLSRIAQIPLIWSWKYPEIERPVGSEPVLHVANVAIDLWLSDTNVCTRGTEVNSCATYEVMIWLGQFNGASPAGRFTGTARVNGRSWDRWEGIIPLSDQPWHIVTFRIPPGAQNLENVGFMDYKPFLQYLVDDQTISSNLHLVGIQAGSEVITGDARLETSKYAVAIKRTRRVVRGDVDANAPKDDKSFPVVKTKPFEHSKGPK